MGMMGGGGQKSTTQETKEIRLPPWVEAASQENYQRAQDVANRPYEAYGGPTVAPLDSTYGIARGMLPGLKEYQGYDRAEAALKGLLGYNPADISKRAVTAPTMADVNLQQYLNPYTGEVERNAIRNMTQAGNIAQTQLASDATKSGGMGGSRQAIQQAVQGAKTVQGIGEKSAELRKEGYDTATKLAQTDLERRYKAAVQTGDWQQAAEIESRRNDLEAHNQTIAASRQLTDTQTAEQAARMNTIAQYLGLGQIKQEQTQRGYDAAAGKWQKKYDYPLEQLNILLAALGMSPYGHTETGTSTTRTSGGGGGLGGILSGILGGAKMLGGMASMGASDRTLKTNIEKLGEVDGLPIYAFDYKADVKKAKKTKRPLGMKRVGPMAQDVETKYPELVSKVAGKRVIDLSSLVEA